MTSEIAVVFTAIFSVHEVERGVDQAALSMTAERA